MTRPMKVAVGAVAVLLLAGFAITYGAMKTVGQNTAAAESVISMDNWQQWQAPTFEPSLEAVLDQGHVTLVPGAFVSYRVSTDSHHYVFAVKTDGGVQVGSDTHRQPVGCRGYSPACVSQVTSDQGLIVAGPVWVQPRNRR